MMCLDGTPKLMDFGVAHFEESNMTKSMDVLGTQGYMAPEQLFDSSRVDARADLFALLVMLTRLVIGNKPNFYEKALMARAISQLPEPLRKVVEGGTRFQRDDRVYNNASQLVRDLLAARNRLEEDGSDAFFASLSGEVVDISVPAVREISEEPLVPPLSNDPLGVPESRLRPTFQTVPVVAAVPLVPTKSAPAGLDEVMAVATPEVPAPPVTRRFTSFFEGGKAKPEGGMDDEVPSDAPVRPNWGRRLRVPIGLPALLGVVGGVVAVGWSDAVPVDVAPTSIISPVLVQPEVPVVDDPVVISTPTVELPESSAPVTSVPAARPTSTVKPATPQAPTPVVSPSPAPEEPKHVELTPTPAPMGTVVVQGKDVSVDFLSATGKSYSPGSVPPGSYTVRATFNDDSVYTSDFRVNVADGQTITIVCSAKFKNCRAP
jgi:serine/threonine protein kinase